MINSEFLKINIMQQVLDLSDYWDMEAASLHLLSQLILYKDHSGYNKQITMPAWKQMQELNAASRKVSLIKTRVSAFHLLQKMKSDLT